MLSPQIMSHEQRERKMALGFTGSDRMMIKEIPNAN
jgi:hypothetical protein